MNLAPYQVVALSAVGALFGIIGLLVLACLAAAVYCAVSNATDRIDTLRARHRDLNTCRAIEQLGTTDHPAPGDDTR